MHSSPRELSSWSGLLWLSFRGTVGGFVGIVGLAAGVAAWFIPATEKVSLAVYVLTLMVCIALIVVLAEAARIAKASAAHPLPRVRFSLDEAQVGEIPRVVLVLDPSPLFNQGLVVSVFLVQQDQYERFFGNGFVQNVQDDGLIQVRLTGLSEGFADVLADLQGSKTQTLARVRVKPYVHQRPEYGTMELL